MSTNIRKKSYFEFLILNISASVFLNVLIMLLGLTESSAGYKEAESILYAGSFFVIMATSGILSPVLEEVLFRGVIYRFFRKKLAITGSVLISAAVFGIYHLNLPQGIYGFLLGALWALGYEYTGSIFTPVAAHVLVNVVTVVFSYSGVYGYIFADGIRIGLSLFVTGIVTLVMGISLARDINRRKN